MTRTILTLTLALMMLTVCGTGCATKAGTTVAVARPGHNLLFGPSWSGLRTFDTPRGQWPATAAYDMSEESVTFRETIIDRQGRHFSERDDYYRRFESVREGKGRR